MLKIDKLYNYCIDALALNFSLPQYESYMKFVCFTENLIKYIYLKSDRGKYALFLCSECYLQ